MGRKRKRQQIDEADQYVPVKKQQTTEPIPDGVFYYSSISEITDWDTQHFWKQRYSLFERYDEGIWMTSDSWFGVTPESIARRIAEHATSVPSSKRIIIDAFCGVGGNSIAFALSGHWQRVYAIEKDRATLECAMHNAEIYGVKDQITFFEGDCFELLGLQEEKTEKTVDALSEIVKEYGVIFASPPWGGTSYRDSPIFDLKTMQPYSLDQLYTSFNKLTKNIILYLPRTSDLRQIADLVEEGRKTQVVHYCIKRASKALCAYLGDWGMINMQGT